MRHIVTHVNVDLDAAASVAALIGELGNTAVVHFWPSNVFPQPGDPCPCCQEAIGSDWCIVDHPAGDKGRLDADGTRHAALRSTPAASTWDPQILAEVDEQDSTGRVIHPRFSLAAIVAALRRSGMGDGDIVRAMLPVFRGLNLLYRDRCEAERQASDCQVIQLETGERIAILPEGPTSPLLGIVLNGRGIAGAIYSDGWNLGVTRYPGHSTPDLRKLQPHLPGWFIHSAGFLAAWGSRKAPATTPPPKGTPQNQVELAHLLLRVFTEEV